MDLLRGYQSRHQSAATTKLMRRNTDDMSTSDQSQLHENRDIWPFMCHVMHHLWCIFAKIMELNLIKPLILTTSFQVKQRSKDMLNNAIKRNQPRPDGRKFSVRNNPKSSRNKRHKTKKNLKKNGGEIFIDRKIFKSMLAKYNGWIMLGFWSV